MVVKRFRALWFPNLEGGFLSFLIEAMVVVAFAALGVVIAALALWIV